MTKYEMDVVESKVGNWVMIDDVVAIIEKKIELIKESNTYRGKVSQGALQSVCFIDDILNQIKA